MDQGLNYWVDLNSQVSILEVSRTEFNPSGLPSEPAGAIETPIVFNPDWLNTTSIIAAMELLGRPMTLDELRRWTEQNLKP